MHTGCSHGHHLAKHEAIVPSKASHVHEYEGIKITLARLGSSGGGAGFCANSQFLPAFPVSCSICTLASAPQRACASRLYCEREQTITSQFDEHQIEMAT
jgi:hypothetical protein